MSLHHVHLVGTPLLIVFGVMAACSSAHSQTTAMSTVPGSAEAVSIDSTFVSPAPIATSEELTDRDIGWRGDLNRIIPAMSDIHPNLFHGTTRAGLEASVAELSSRVPMATDDELMVGVLRIVASIGAGGCEGHTGVFVWGTGTYPVDSLPLRLWLFDAQLVIVDALAPYESLIGARIDSIGGHPIADVLAAVEPLVSRDNDQTIRLVTPRLVLIPQVLRGLGLAGDGPLSLRVSSLVGDGQSIAIDPIPMAEYNGWAGPYGLHLPTDPDVLYLSRIGEALWWEVLPDGRTLFVQYNRVDRLASSQLADLKAALHGQGVERVILDIRHNYGGELSALSAIEPLFTDPAVDRSGALFVLTGRNTFSAGSLLVARLQRDTAAVLVGEPMSGCPTTWGDSSEFTLQHSGLAIDVASEFSVGIDKGDDRLTIEPDVPAVLTLQDWVDGVDPALEAAMAVGR